MKHLGWILLALLLLAASAALGGWTAITDLRRAREWNVIQAGEAGAELRGVRVRVADVWAATAPGRADRAAIVVRLAISGPEAARRAWTGCDVSLRDGAGRTWLPLFTPDAFGAIRTVAPDGESRGRCTPLPYDAPPDGGEILSDQFFVVPAELLKGGRLRVSALGTRPDALEFPVRPVLRPLP